MPANLPFALEASLRGLGTDHVDLYHIHWPNPEVPLAETMGASAAGRGGQGGGRDLQLRAAEPAGARGGADRFRSAARPSAEVQSARRAIEGPIVDASDAARMPIVAYSALAQGLLTGGYRSIGAVPDHMKVTRFYSGDNGIAKHGEAGAEAEAFAAIAALDALCGEAGLSMPQLALAWLLQKSNVASVLVGARTPESSRRASPPPTSRCRPTCWSARPPRRRRCARGWATVPTCGWAGRSCGSPRTERPGQLLLPERFRGLRGIDPLGRPKRRLCLSTFCLESP